MRRRANLGEETRAADHGRELRSKHLDGDIAIVASVAGEVNGRHAACPELTGNAIPAGQLGGQPTEELRRLIAIERARQAYRIALVPHRWAPPWPGWNCRSSSAALVDRGES